MQATSISSGNTVFGIMLLGMCMALFAAAPSEAAEVYKCKDENGKVKYQSQACDDATSQEKLKLRRGPSTASDDGDAGDAADGNSDTPLLDKMIASTTDERMKRNLEIRKEQCAIARQNLQAYENADILKARNEDGSERVLSAEEMGAEKQKARSFLENNCK
ncbi:MAG: DUF4124 domain-containing protein [Gammaproteobacteria bacterium]|nr:DUF4124 domain-containing protein [Gammaproteobacteria bacterium]